ADHLVVVPFGEVLVAEDPECEQGRVDRTVPLLEGGNQLVMGGSVVGVEGDHVDLGCAGVPTGGSGIVGPATTDGEDDRAARTQPYGGGQPDLAATAEQHQGPAVGHGASVSRSSSVARRITSRVQAPR